MAGKMSLKSFYTNADNYRVIYNKKYEVEVYRPATGTVIHNIFQDTYIKTSTYMPFVVVGPLGNEVVVSSSTLLSEYEGTNGEKLQSLLQQLNPNERVKANFALVNKRYYVSMVPSILSNTQLGKLVLNRSDITLFGTEQICVDYQIAVKEQKYRDKFIRNYAGILKLLGETEEGSLYSYELTHGTGDYIVCDSLPDASGPDWQTAQVVNGGLFEQIFDMRYISSVSMNLFSLFLAMECMRLSTSGFRLAKSIAAKTGTAEESMTYDFIGEENLATTHSVKYRLCTNNKSGVLHATLNKSNKDITAKLTVLGETKTLYSFSYYKEKIRLSCEKKGIKEISDLEVLSKFTEKLLFDTCNMVYIAELSVSEETDRLVNCLFKEAQRMFNTLGSGNLESVADKESGGAKLLTMTYMHSAYNIKTVTGIRVRLSDSTMEAYILSNDTHKQVELVKRTALQSEASIREFIHRYRVNLLQVVSGSVFGK